MPLHTCWEPSPGLQLGLWQIIPGELVPENYPKALLRPSQAPVSDQKLSVWVLLEQMLKRDPPIAKDAFGKPYLSDSSFKLSIAHAPQWAFVGLDREKELGVDVEGFRTQLITAAHRFLSEEERLLIADSKDEIRSLALAWSAKESIYKWYGKKQLDWRQQIHLRFTELNTEGSFTARLLLPREQPLTVHYRFLENHVLTWAQE